MAVCVVLRWVLGLPLFLFSGEIYLDEEILLGGTSDTFPFYLLAPGQAKASSPKFTLTLHASAP